MNLLRYIQGSRTGKKAHDVERKAMQDPFLAEALEGYDTVQGEHAERIEQMQQRIAEKSKRQPPLYLWWSMAASLLLCIVAGTYFLTRENGSSTERIAFLEEKNAAFSAPKESVEIMESVENKDVVITQKHEPKAKQIAAAPEKKRTENKPLPLMEDNMPILVEEEAEAVSHDANEEVAMEKAAHVVAAQVAEAEAPPLPSPNLHDIIVNDSVTSQPSRIALNKTQNQIDEVVVVGYGAMREKQVVGSASMRKSVSAEQSQPTTAVEEFDKYVKDNMLRPTDSCASIKGEVILTFTVNKKTGKPENINVQKSLCSSSDKEAIRLLENYPTWTKKRGQRTAVVKF